MANIKPSLIDKIMREINPQGALKRLEAKQGFDIMAGSGNAYAGARSSRFRTYRAWNQSTPGHERTQLTNYDRMSLMLEAMDLYRNNEIFHGAVNRFADYTIWLGIGPVSETTDPAWNQLADDWWNDIYVPTVDYEQRQGIDLISYEKLVVKARPTAGEVGFAMLKNGQLQPIEAERIRTPNDFLKDPNTRDGIKYSESGIVLGYYVCPRNSQGYVNPAKYNYIRRENMIHCWEPWRFDQNRGVPSIHADIAKFRDLDETDEGTLNKVKMEARQLFTRKTESGGAANEMPRGSYTKTDADGNLQRVETHEWGQVHNLGINESMAPLAGVTPNSQHVAYMEYQLRVIASCLNIPYEYLMLIFTSGSFSAQKAAMLHAQHTFRGWHDWIVKTFLNRLRNWRIAKAINDGVLPPAPLDVNTGISQWHKASWRLPYFGWVDPQKQNQADAGKVALGTTSISAVIRTEGGSRDKVFSEKSADLVAAYLYAKKANEEIGADVFTHNDISVAAMPGQIGPQNDEDDADSETDKKKIEKKDNE